MRGHNTDINLKDYSDTVRYLEQFQEITSKTFSAEFQKSGAEITEETDVKRSPEPLPAPFSMYGPSDGFYSSRVQGQNILNPNVRNGNLVSERGIPNHFGSFKHAEIGVENMISAERGAPMFDYHYSQHNTHGGMSTNEVANFANAANTQNEFAVENSTTPFGQGVAKGCLSPSLQNCPQQVAINPLAGLTELAEKANFASELARNGVAESRFSSQPRRGQINGPAVQYNFPEAPRGRSWSRSIPEGVSSFFNGGQQPFQADEFSPTLSTGSSILTDSELGSPCHTARPRHFFPYSESESDLSPTEINPYDRSRASYQNYNSRTFANYKLWSNQTESITPNVTVVPDPRSKLSQLFKSGSRSTTKSEEILKEHLQNFGKYLPTQGDKKQEKKADTEQENSWTGEEAVKEKKTSTTASNAKESSEENTVFPCKWVNCEGSIFSEQDDLVRHIEKVHIDQRKADDLYICYWKDCSRQRRAFNARYKLVIHMRVHSGEKPNKCTVSSTGSTKAMFVLYCLRVPSDRSRQLFCTQFVGLGVILSQESSFGNFSISARITYQSSDGHLLSRNVQIQHVQVNSDLAVLGARFDTSGIQMSPWA